MRRLKYFSITDDEKTLKSKYKELAKKYHPDIYGESGNKIMQDIHEEMEFCANAGNASGIIGKHVNPFDIIAEVFNDLKKRKPGMPNSVIMFHEIVVSMKISIDKIKKDNKKK